MAACAVAPSSAPYSPECQEHRQIVPECNALAVECVEWRRYQGRSLVVPQSQAQVPPKIGAVISSVSLPECRDACRRKRNA